MLHWAVQVTITAFRALSPAPADVLRELEAVAHAVGSRRGERLGVQEARMAQAACLAARTALLHGPSLVRRVQVRAGLGASSTVRQLEDAADWCVRMWNVTLALRA